MTWGKNPGGHGFDRACDEEPGHFRGLRRYERRPARRSPHGSNFRCGTTTTRNCGRSPRAPRRCRLATPIISAAVVADVFRSDPRPHQGRDPLPHPRCVAGLVGGQNAGGDDRWPFILQNPADRFEHRRHRSRQPLDCRAGRNGCSRAGGSAGVIGVERRRADAQGGEGRSRTDHFGEMQNFSARRWHVRARLQEGDRRGN